ncbi:MAG: ABC transporter substrate-binding protein [Cyanobacteriota bacterium]|nr:ABC transporter substrate-binding protein [Cyanobacteriota bacterium]
MIHFQPSRRIPKRSIASSISSSICSGAIAILGGLWLLSPLAFAQPSPSPTSLFPTSPDRHWQSIQQSGTLRVGLDPSLGATYLYADPANNTYRGFEWDILKAMVEPLGLKLQTVYIPWSQQLQALTDGEVDLVMGAREATGLDPERFLASQPYYRSPQRLVIAANNPESIEDLSNLFGKKVGIVVDSTGAALLETYNQSRGNAIRLFATSNPERLFAQLEAGQLDAVLIDQPVAVAAIQKATPTLKMVGSPLFPTPLVVVMAANHGSLKQALDQSLTTLTNDGTLKAILEEWQLWDPVAMPLASSED